MRSDSAGTTHTFAGACRAAGVGFSFGCPVDAHVRDAAEILNRAGGWSPAIESGGGIREGAWVAEATHLVDIRGWPAGTWLILRKERPHPGAQLRFTDSDGLRVTAFITDTAHGVVADQWRARTTPPPTRPGGGPHPRGQGHRTAQPALSPLRGQRGMAGNHLSGNRSGRIDQTDRIRRQPRSGHLRDPHVSLPGPARRRPHHPRRPPNPATHRRHLAMGHRHRPRPAPTTSRLYLKHPDSSVHPTRRPTGPGKPAHRATPADPSHPSATISTHTGSTPAHYRPSCPHAKSRPSTLRDGHGLL